MLSVCKTSLVPLLAFTALSTPLLAQDPLFPPSTIASISTSGPTPASPPPDAALVPPATATPASSSTTTGQFQAQDFLQSLGVEFPDGAIAVYVESSGNLVVHNTPANLQKIDQLFQNGFKPQEEPDGVKMMRAKLGLTVPKVNFGNATVAQAVDYLERESARLSSIGGVKDRIQINVRDLPTDAPAANGEAKKPREGRINLHLKNVTLHQAIQAVAAQAGLTCKVEPASVVLEPRTFSDSTLVTKNYPFQFNK